MPTALLLVDVQSDFLNRPGLEPDAPTLVARLAEFLGQARSRGWLIAHGRTQVRADGADAMPHWRKAGPLPCVAGTPGAAAPDALASQPGELIAIKRFFSAFEDPALLAGLRAAAVDRLVICGLYTHACVRQAALDAYAAGLEVFIASDAVSAYDPEHARLSLEWLDGRAATCAPAADLLERLA